MESKNMIVYKWDQGVYSLEDMTILVKYHQMSPEQFFEITRYNYDAAVQKIKNQKQKI